VKRPKLKPITSAVHAAMISLTFTGAGIALSQSTDAENEPGAESSKKSYGIPAGPLGPALSRFAAQAEVLLSFDPALTEGKTTPGLSGEYSIGEALAAFLAGSGLEAVKSASGYVLQARREENAGGETQLGTVTVTDSAIAFNDLPRKKDSKRSFNRQRPKLRCRSGKRRNPFRSSPRILSKRGKSPTSVRRSKRRLE
jgi:hypothetical protein